MVSQQIIGVVGQFSKQILADFRILGRGADAHALRPSDDKRLVIVLGNREHHEGNVVRKGLRILLNRVSDIGGRINRSIVSEARAVARHLVDGRPALLAQIVRGDFQRVGGVIDELEETLHAFLIEDQLAVLVVVAAAERLHDVQEVVAGARTMGHAPGAGAGILHIRAELHEVFPSELAGGNLRRKSLGFFHGPAVLDQHLLIVVDDADRQVKRHGIRHAIHGERIERAVNKSILIQVAQVEQHADSRHGRHVADGEDIRAVAVLVSEDQVLTILAPVDALIVRLELNLDVLALGGIALVEAVGGSDDRIRDRDKVVVVRDLERDRLSRSGCADSQHERQREQERKTFLHFK